MKKIREILAITLVLLITVITNAQKNENSLLWKIEGDDIKTSYLFGTIHMLPQKDFTLSDKVKKAFNDSDKVALELDMDEQDFFKDMMKYMYLTKGESLKNHMDEDEYKKLDTYLKEKLKVGMDKFLKNKPFFLSSTLLTTFIGEQIASYEMSLIGMSKTANKEILGLETIDDQMAAVSGSKSYEAQIDDIIKMLDEKEKTVDFYENLIELYKKEDVDGIYNSMGKYFEDDKLSKDKMLDNRNKKWIPEIKKLSKENKMFYAVGAAHLGGKIGVIKLLKNAGYKVTPVLK